MADLAQTRVTLVVPAEPARIFEVLTTPSRLPELDPTGTMTSTDAAPRVAARGEVFEMGMVASGGVEPLHYRAEHRVEELEQDRVVGWSVVPLDGDPRGWSWRFELNPLDDERTEVTLTYDWSGISEENAARYGIPDHDSADLEACLTRLALAARTEDR